MHAIFDLCRPHQDVLRAQMRDEEFAAELSKVIEANATEEYQDPRLFFRYTHPTRGMAIHRKHPRRFLAALRLLTSA